MLTEYERPQTNWGGPRAFGVVQSSGTSREPSLDDPHIPEPATSPGITGGELN